MLYKTYPALPIKGLSLEGSILEKIAAKDYLQFAPYHTFSYVVRFLREAALDPKVKSVKITVYRLAKLSDVASSLINAVKNGKSVTGSDWSCRRVLMKKLILGMPSNFNLKC